MYVFYAASAASVDGCAILTSLKFYACPLFLIVGPTGSSLSDCRILVAHQGAFTPTLLSELWVYRALGDPIARAQDREFEQALLDAQGRQIEADEEEQAAIHEQNRVAAEFAALPDLVFAGQNVIKVRFYIPDNVHREKVFARDAPVSFLFVFVRGLLWPRPFALFVGYPREEVVETGAAIETIWTHPHLLLYVQ
jgi:hypothetical protein